MKHGGVLLGSSEINAVRQVLEDRTVQPSQCLPKAVDHRQGPRGCWEPHIHARSVDWPGHSTCRWPAKDLEHSDNNLLTGKEQAIRELFKITVSQACRVRLATVTGP